MARQNFLLWLIGLLFCVLFLGLFNLAVIKGNKFRKLSNANCIRLIPQFGCRGNILDRNGAVIVGNKLSYDLLLLPQEAAHLDKVFASVAAILGSEPEKLRKNFRSDYISSSLPVAIATDIELKKAILLGEYKVDEPGIIIQPKPLRYYPYGNLGSHIIGYVSEIDRWRLTKLEDYGYKTRDIVGFGGVEEKYDYYLRQEEGGLSVEVNNRGRFTRVLGFEPPRNGRDIQLSLDLRIQKIVEEKLEGRKGSVVVLDPFSAEVLAMASYPNFKPGVFVSKSNTTIAGLFNNPDSPMLNRAISAVYPPASVFKVVVASAALDTKKISLSTSFSCPGFVMVGKRKFSCWDVHGQQNIFQALAHSCDVFFYRSGLLAGAQAIHDYASRLGLGRTTGIELPYEASGFIPSPLLRRINHFSGWFDGDTANLSIGQGECLVSPLQVAVMISVFANRGYLPVPYIVSKIGDMDLAAHKRKPAPVAIKKDTLENVRRALRLAVTDTRGTANVLSSLAVQVAGKTGTAQVARGQTHAWFAGFFPYDKPRYAICVFLENGGPGHAACVLTKQIIESMLNEGLL